MANFIEQNLIKILEDNGIKGEIKFSPPPKQEMGDLAFACFGLAKEQGKNPVEVAKDLALKLSGLKNEVIEKVIAFGPYINFFINPGAFAKSVLIPTKKSKNKTDKRKVLIEYPSQNTHKEFHIGHLRNVCIGNTLVQLFREMGHEVIPVNYINDFGAHVVKCLWGIMKFYKGELPKENVQKWLGQVYAEASTYIKANEEVVKPELDALQKKLEARDSSVMKLFKKTRDLSLDGFDRLQKELKAVHKHTFLESEVKDKGQKIVDMMMKKGIVTVGERGALIADLSQYGLDIALVRKATGAGVYLTSDLALAEEKFHKYKVDESINVTGVEQNFYFKQLFKVLELNGFKHKMTHIGYGLVNLPEGKMSSRAGNVILYEDLRDQVKDKILNEVKVRHTDWSEKQIEDTAMTLTMAVLKFTMQQHEANKNITFNLQEAVSFDGFSAPYILYVVARINSLKKKAGKKYSGKIDYSLLKSLEEKKLLMILGGFDEMVNKAWENYNPSVVTKYCFDLAQSFNDFYNKQSVLSADSEDLVAVRLSLCEVVKNTLVKSLGLLTIDVVEEM